ACRGRHQRSHLYRSGPRRERPSPRPAQRLGSNAWEQAVILARREYSNLGGLAAAGGDGQIQTVLCPRRRTGAFPRRDTVDATQGIDVALHDVDEAFAADHVQTPPRGVIEQIVGIPYDRNRAEQFPSRGIKEGEGGRPATADE